MKSIQSVQPESPATTQTVVCANRSQKQTDPYRFSRVMYMAEAALEYFIALMVGEAYLAKLATAMQVPDALVGVLTAFVSLGATFQIVAIFLINRTPVKRWVTLCHFINEVCFSLLYLLPEMPIGHTVQIVLFVLLLLVGNILNSVVNSPKINWFMSLVDDHKRGRFTANKEIISLLSGIVFTFCVGRVIDRFEEQNNLRGAFLCISITLFALSILHTLTMVFSKEKVIPHTESARESLRGLFRDRGFLRIVLITVLWSCATYVATPFYGTYKNGELGFSMTFIAILNAAHCLVRALFSRPLGRFADKNSFLSMLNICLSVEAVALAVNIFTVPANGHVLYTVYFILHGVALAGANSSLINLIYDYVKPNQRTAAMAIRCAVAGIVGFLTTFVASFLVSAIQKAGNQLFGIPVYAQQVTTCFALLFILLQLLLVNVTRKCLART